MSATEDFVSRCVTAATEDKAMIAVKEVLEQAIRDQRVEAELSCEVGMRSEDTIVPASGRLLDEGDVLVLGSDVIHSVGNPSADRVTCALHVYGGDLLHEARSMWNEPDWREEPYDLKRVTGTTLPE